MIKLKITLFFVLLHGLVYAQKLKFDSGDPSQKEYYQEINFEVVNEKMILSVEINNKEYSFLFDTGAPNVISKRIYNEINSQKSRKLSVSDANNKINEMELVVVDSIKLGNVTFLNSVALVSDLENHSIMKCFKIDGLIGSNLFHNSVIKISLKDKKIIITNHIKKLNPKTKPSKLTLVGQQKSPYVALNYAEKGKSKVIEYALIDTGMSGFFDISNRTYAILSKENVFKELSKSIGSGSIGIFGPADATEQTLIRIPTFSIQNTIFNNLIVNTTDDNNSRLGLELLEYGDIIIDFKHKKFYFEAEENIVLEKKPPVYQATIIEDKYVIGFVWDEKLKDKFEYGDEILRINSFHIPEMNVCELINIAFLLKNASSREIEVKSKKKETITKITVTN
jgi:predicted aspartyl protease